MTEHIAAITLQNAQALLVEESFTRPVLIDFWADWCAPCKVLMPILEKLAVEYAGGFLLAKVNCDEQQAIASQFGVRSLPTLLLMKDGQPVDGFAGAQPESAIRELLERHLPKPWDKQLDQARMAIAAEDYATALPLLRQASQDSRQRPDICTTLAHVLVLTNRLDEARTILDAVRLGERDHYYEQVAAQLQLKEQAGKSPEIQALEERLNSHPEDLDVAYQLAIQYSQHEHHREALQLLLTILKTNRDFNEGAARRTMLDIFKSLGSRDPLVVEYQRQLFSLLY